MLSNRFKNDGVAILKLNKLQVQNRDIVSEKVRAKIYALENVRCAVCDKTNFEQIAEKDRYGLEMSVVICKECGLVQTNPRMTQAAYNQFYNNEYRPLYVGSEKATSLFFEQQYEHGRKIFSYLKVNGALPKSKNSFILEVGCGAGGILQFFKEKGFKTLGTDLGESYLAYGRKKGLDLRAGFLREQNLDAKPDLIIYSHVVEHLLDPNEELAYLKNITHKNSILYIEVPGILNLKKPYKHDFLRYLQNAHTYHFSMNSLKNLLHKNGFEVIKGTEDVKMISKPIRQASKEIYINCYAPTMEYLKTLETEREKVPFYPYSVSMYWIKKDIKHSILTTLDILGIRTYVKRFRKYFSQS